MTELYSFYDHLHMCLRVQIRRKLADGTKQFVELPLTDEMQANWSRDKDGTFVTSKKAFLAELCELWRQSTGEHVQPMYNGEGVEWTVGPIVIDGEVVTKEVEGAERKDSIAGRHDGERKRLSQHPHS